MTQETLDQEGIKTAADLTRIVPSLNTVANPGGGQQTFSIRGIVGSTGAATTSVYLDDVNLTKRANGGVAQNNGVLIPILYDLARVEVLKGPQGTLFGGSSEGGTIRFITPTPSLTDYSGMARGEFSTMGSRSAPATKPAAQSAAPSFLTSSPFGSASSSRSTAAGSTSTAPTPVDLIRKMSIPTSTGPVTPPCCGRSPIIPARWFPPITSKTSRRRTRHLDRYLRRRRARRRRGRRSPHRGGVSPTIPAPRLWRSRTEHQRRPSFRLMWRAQVPPPYPAPCYFRPGVTYGPFPRDRTSLSPPVSSTSSRRPLPVRHRQCDAELRPATMNVKLISSYLKTRAIATPPAARSSARRPPAPGNSRP